MYLQHYNGRYTYLAMTSAGFPKFNPVELNLKKNGERFRRLFKIASVFIELLPMTSLQIQQAEFAEAEARAILSRLLSIFCTTRNADVATFSILGCLFKHFGHGIQNENFNFKCLSKHSVSDRAFHGTITCISAVQREHGFKMVSGRF